MCCLIDPDALPAIDRMCRRYPKTTVVIDHFSRTKDELNGSAFMTTKQRQYVEVARALRKANVFRTLRPPGYNAHWQDLTTKKPGSRAHAEAAARAEQLPGQRLDAPAN